MLRFRANLAVAATVLLASGTGADAFFDMFFGRGRSAPPAARSYADPHHDGRRYTPRAERREHRHSGGVTYCVRLCDGRHFPINYRGGDADLCNAMCPASPTKIFSGSSIDDAVSPDGKRYSDIPNAFVYRERLVDGCTCNGKSPIGLVRQNIADDDSLQRGDILATEQGFMSYRGDTRRKADFVPLDMKGLPKAMRGRLAETNVQPAPSASKPAETTGAAPADRQEPVPRQASR